MPKISVIVPVYKVEKYLHECVDSILAQTYTDFELILVDDGSPDNCGKICDEYAEKDSRIRVIHQENQGVSGARNTGIDAARGEFIAFIDSDDVVSAHYLEVLLSGMEDDVDIVACKYQTFQDGADIIPRDDFQYPNYQCLDSVSLVIALHNGGSGISVGVWQKLFRTDIVKSHRFPVGRIHEDQYFTPLVCYEARNSVICHLPLYFYRNRKESITHCDFNPKCYDDIMGFDYCIRYFQERNEDKIASAIQDMRSYRIATYSIYARRDNVLVPAEYRINLFKALYYIRKRTDDNYFQYYLGQIHPKLPIIHAYWVKIKRILHITK